MCSATTRLQLGLPDLAGCAPTACRTAGWPATLREPEVLPLPVADDALITLMPMHAGCALHCDFDALPFPNQSRPGGAAAHALELARDPHHTLREVERVLVPEGRVVILGFNPASLWGLRQRLGARAARRVGPARRAVPAACGRVHGLLAPARLVAAAELRGRGWPLRLLSSALRFSALARTQCLDGTRGRTLVAGVRRRLFSGGGQARARHAPGRPGAPRGPQGAQCQRQVATHRQRRPVEELCE
jgi:SAM-dependent methyltransferase